MQSGIGRYLYYYGEKRYQPAWNEGKTDAYGGKRWYLHAI